MTILMIAFSIISFLNPFSYFGGNEMSPKSKTGYKINAQSANYLKKKYHMNPCGIGLKVNEKIESLDLTFQYYEPVENINEARSLLMKICKDHYEYIRNSSEIQPYLIEPFTINNVSVSLFIQTKDRENVYHPKIARASFFGSVAMFCTNDRNNIYKTPAEIEEPTEYFLDIAEGRIPPPVYKELQE